MKLSAKREWLVPSYHYHHRGRYYGRDKDYYWWRLFETALFARWNMEYVMQGRLP